MSPDTTTGVLLVNLGTPKSTSVRDVRRYLREFLGDPDVIDLPRFQRWLLLNLVILPFRPRRTAHAYRQIWEERGSPLAFHSEDLCAATAAALGSDFEVRLAMRYGSPSISSALCGLRDSGVSRILTLPLFPHFSGATVGSVESEVRRCAEKLGIAQKIARVPVFYDHPDFISAIVQRAAPEFSNFAPDHVLFSYHGLPEQQIRAADPTGRTCLVRPDCCDAIGPQNANCYRAQCFATTRAVAVALGLASTDYSVAFQSRLGRTPWLRPYLDEHLAKLADAGVKRLAVLCPSFVADCLETLEEIGMRARETWVSRSGGELRLVPCVNATPASALALAEILREAAASSDRRADVPPR